MSERARTLALCGVLVLGTLAVYANTWGHGFVNYDDDVTIVNLELIRLPPSLANLPRFFEPTVRRGLPEYMPLKNLSYAVDYALFGLSPAGFRVQQQLWYVASVLLFFFWCRAVLSHLPLTAARAPWLAFAAAALFALHPAHVESVTWLSGRKDVLSGAFMLAAMLCARGGGWKPLSLAAGFTALGLLSKPTAVAMPGLLLMQDWVEGRLTLSRPGRRWGFHLAILAMCGGFALFYVSFLGGHAGAAADSFQARPWLRWGQQYAAFLRLGILPLGLSPLYPSDSLDPVLFSPNALFGLLLACLLVLSAIACVRRRSPALLPLGLFAIPIAPIVLSPPWGQLVAARYLFHAVGGVSLAVVLGGAFLAARAPRWWRALAGIVIALCLLWGGLTWSYNATWRTSSTLWEGALRQFPRFTRLHDMAARAHLLEGHPERAIHVLAACLEVDPDNGACLAQMGDLLLEPDPARGEAMLRRAVALDASGRAAHALAVHLLRTQRADEGLALYERALNGKTVSAESLDLLVRLSIAVGHRAKALAYAHQMVRAAATNHPGSPAPVRSIRTVAEALGDPELAERVRRAAAVCHRSDCFQKKMGW